ncbi:MAG: D-Ala-D-Ala carboxypeptidase family metallohydrolase [Hyphomicrobiaceae bacterium]
MTSKMVASLRAGAAALAALILQSATALLLSTAPAQAELLAFWENDNGKPSVTGNSRRATGKRRLPAQFAGSDDDAPVARKSKKRLAKSYDADDEAPAARAKTRKVRVASLGGNDAGYDPRPSRKSVSGGGGGGITWAASSGCLNGTLRSIVQDVASQYGSLTVSSTCRDRGHNASVGGAKKSQHLTGDAADFRVHGNVSGAMAFLRNHGSVGGFHHYGGGLFHIDTGPKRRW